MDNKKKKKKKSTVAYPFNSQDEFYEQWLPIFREHFSFSTLFNSFFTPPLFSLTHTHRPR